VVGADQGVPELGGERGRHSPLEPRGCHTSTGILRNSAIPWHRCCFYQIWETLTSLLSALFKTRNLPKFETSANMGRTISKAWQAYCDRWYRPAPRERRRLRRMYKNDHDSFLLAYYRRRPEGVDYSSDMLLTSGMALFTAVQAKLSQQARQATYAHNGRICLDDLLSALRGGERPSKNYVLVAIDFEGGTEKITEIGISSTNTKEIFDEDTLRLSIHDEHYATAKRGSSGGFLFGETTRIATHMLATVLRELLAFDHKECLDGIILVGHGLWAAEIHQLDKYGVSIESFPSIVGTLDTSRLCVRGRGGRLCDIINAYNIPYRRGSIHCAGNDAHYTLQLMLASMLERLNPFEIPDGSWIWMDVILELINRPLPAACPRSRHKEDDWQQHMNGDLDTALFLDLTEESA